MTRMGTVWDQTVDVLRGRGAILAGIALPLLFLPSVVNGVLQAYVGEKPGGMAALAVGLVGIAVVVVTLLGVLSVTAVASDPATGGAAARGIAMRRIGALIGVLLAVVGAAMLAALPVVVLLVLSGTRMSAAGVPDFGTASGGMLALAVLASIALFVALIWLSVRLAPLVAVVANERRGLGAVRRSIALTRGSAMRLFGVQLLYAIVTVVVMGAAGGVFGVVIVLLLGPGVVASALLAVVTAAITALASVVQSVFCARFYALAVEHEAAVTEAGTLA